VARHKLANGFATTDELARTKAALREQEGETHLYHHHHHHQHIKYYNYYEVGLTDQSLWIAIFTVKS